MKAKDLRNSILQMAVQGKLVPQDPNDEPASALLDRIRAERAKLIKEKKIKAPKGGESVIYRASDGSHYEKRGKGEPVCIDGEIPFEIPESWEWVRLGGLGILQTGKTPSTSHRDYFDGPIPFVTPGDITYEHTLPTIERSLSIKGAVQSRVADSLSILQVCIGGSAGKTCLIVRKVAFNQQINAITSYIPDIAEYLFLVMCAPIIQSRIESMKAGTATPIINKGTWSEFLVPLPPIAEQKAIVIEINKILPLVDEYGALEDTRERLDAELPDRLRKSILQLAVQGKLVEQNPTDEPASVLLDRIRSERAALVKAKKIRAPKGGESIIYRASDGGYYEKRGKDMPICIDNEIPFDIPESWEWCRLDSLAMKITDGTHHSPPNESEGQYMYVTAKNIKDDGVHTEGITYVSREVHEEIYTRCNPSLGDILLIKDGATTGVVTVNNIEEEFSLLSSVALIKLPKEIESWYITYYLRSEQFRRYIKSLMSGTGIPRITLRKIDPLLVPIPPSREQRRIVSEIEAILTNL